MGSLYLFTYKMETNVNILIEKPEFSLVFHSSLYDTEYPVAMHRLYKATSRTCVVTQGSWIHTEGQNKPSTLISLQRESPSLKLAEKTLNSVGVTESNKQLCHCTFTINLASSCR